ncbi:MAG: STAS domain-containing protein [Candidatus Polarisedimenticolaceae bacterium]|nr:STAS domain-containing protein [Candidatus Polarisedimenticolaceae bacterium]
MSASIELTKSGAYCIQGELTLDTVTALLQQSKKLFTGQKEITINLAEVTHSNSAGLALLLEWLSQCKASGTTIQFKDIPDALTAIASLYNVRGLLPKTGHPLSPKNSGA